MQKKTLLNQYQYTTTMKNKIKNFTQSNASSREEPQVHHSVKKEIFQNNYKQFKIIENAKIRIEDMKNTQKVIEFSFGPSS